LTEFPNNSSFKSSATFVGGNALHKSGASSVASKHLSQASPSSGRRDIILD
jgi:hypothetical protein